MDLPELQDHATAEQAASILRWAAADAENSGVLRGTAQEWQVSYLAWVEGAERQLSSVFDRASVEGLIFSDHYWMLRTSPTGAQRLTQDIQSELQRRIAVLHRLGDVMDAQAA